MRFAAAAFCRCRAGWRCCFVKLLPLFCINGADAWRSARCDGGRFAFRNGLPCRQYGLFQASMRPVPEWGGATPTCIRWFVNILLRQGRSAVGKGKVVAAACRHCADIRAESPPVGFRNAWKIMKKRIFLKKKLQKFCGFRKMRYLCTRNQMIKLVRHWDMV